MRNILVRRGVYPRTISPKPNLFLRIVLQVPDFLRWHADDEGVVGDILGHYGACSHHHIITDGDAGQDGDVAAYPHVVADAHGLGDAQVLTAAISSSLSISVAVITKIIVFIVYYFFLLSLHRNSTSGCGIRPSFH